ncbi:MAG: hypothetical protein JXA33_09705 [Anaerolineae bacterium]|nr:hypothetical protein [Anaerolineae bacterium]
MKKENVILQILRFLGISLLIDLGLLVLVGIWCWVGPTCTAAIWSERMFWAAMIAFISAVPVIVASLNTASGVESTTFGSAWAQKAALDTIQQERNKLGKRWIYFLRMFTIALGAFLISMAIDLLSR